VAGSIADATERAKDPDGDAEHEAAYRFRRSCWNQGIATEALRACLRHGFEHLKFAAVAAVVEPGNVASVRVLEKAGMAYVKDTACHGIPVRKYLVRGEDLQRGGPVPNGVPQERY